MPEFDKAGARYLSPAGKKRSTSAEGDSPALAEDLLKKKLLLMVGTISSETTSTAGDTANYPLKNAVDQYQDAFFSFANGDGNTKEVIVRDVSLTFKQAGSTNNNLNTTLPAVDNFVQAWIASKADNADYTTLLAAYYLNT